MLLTDIDMRTYENVYEDLWKQRVIWLQHYSKDSNCYNSNDCRKVMSLIKYENKNVLFNRSYMRHEMNKIQSKDLNTELIKFYCLVMMNDKKHILGDRKNRLSHFINLLGNHTKMISLNIDNLF